ncbi:roadblock/LC7 domain-containing protein [Methanomicrobium antiquum]|uniref:Roadblock/LC7 domain-containing protein n=1 Tax=Methanomicrobium antiquum TaxID=487686 RepID=A0AAF0FZY9_9EURY|nr:roadblock/LC7 domain-containing protein [Methanomicrobium antiquum]MDD3977155.1 roadblock/LC7 domain-containing protein [Methanomicrobium sp.]WFN37609.1 roadblock/LC7 domain-containing protein [Methanomicrobium antiquum]
MGERDTSKNKINGFVSRIMAMDGIMACAIVSTEGQILGKSDSDLSPSPFLGITGATMYASAEATCSTFHISAPDSIIMETKNKDGMILVKSAGRKNLIVIIINKTDNISKIKDDISDISDKLVEEL